MHPDIAKRFEALESRRKALVARVKALPPERQTKKPDSKSFSPIEVIVHMALTERGNVAFLEKTPPSTLKGKKPKVTFLFRSTVEKMRNPSKPLGTLPSMVPKGEFSIQAADKAWAEVRKETAEYLEQVDNPDAPFIKFLFFFGTSSVSDYFDLLEAHMNYHEVRFPAV